MGIMQGGPDGNFHPSDKVTRAQMAAIICRVLGEEDGRTINGTQFLDMPETHWANSYVVRVASLGIVNGYGDGTFTLPTILPQQLTSRMQERLDRHRLTRLFSMRMAAVFSCPA